MASPVPQAAQVAFRETVTERAEFAYMHKKQAGGAASMYA
jgi:translation elongation factor EF-G